MAGGVRVVYVNVNVTSVLGEKLGFDIKNG
jgi:hypothetical protein